MQRAIERRDAGADRGERVHVRRAHRAHRAGGAVLLVVGVQDQQDLERALEHLVRLVLAADAERHVDEVADVVQVVPGELVRQPARVAEGKGGDGRQLGQQAHPLEVAVGRVVDVLGVRIEGGQRSDHAQQHPHRVGVVAEALQELGDVGVDVGVELDLLFPLARAAACWAARPRTAGRPPRGTWPSPPAARWDSPR